MTPEFEETLLDTLWINDNARTEVYVILDAARDDQIYDAAISQGPNCICLYSGKIAPELAKVAPYLVKLKKEAAFTESILRNGWGQSWGIFLQSAASVEEVRKHLHGLLTVRDEEGNKIIFRYYDPRVFRVYLPTCNASELTTVFGPVDAFMVEARDSSVLTEFRKEADALKTEQRSLLRAFSKQALEEDLTP
jgi:hypothetical protein